MVINESMENNSAFYRCQLEFRNNNVNRSTMSSEGPAVVNDSSIAEISVRILWEIPFEMNSSTQESVISAALVMMECTFVPVLHTRSQS